MQRANIILATTLAGLALAGAAAAQTAAPPEALSQLGNNVYLSTAGGSNSGAVVTPHGIVMIDAKKKVEETDALIGQIKQVSSLPITHVILTGAGEGTSGLNSELLPKGVTVISYKGTPRRIVDVESRSGARLPDALMPSKLTQGTKETITIDGVRFVVLHIAASHTDAESSVYLPDTGIVFTGYVIQTRPDFPIIHPEWGGSALGWLEFTRYLISLDAKTYVLGTGQPVDKAELQRRLDAQQATVDRIRAMIKDGKSQADIRTALGTTAKCASPTQFGCAGGREVPNYVFSEVAYDELKAAR